MLEIFKQEKLPYRYDALEPYIDMQTMEIHYTKHHAGYVKKLNNAVKDHKKLHNKTIKEILSNIDMVPEEIKQDVINSGGGHYNHTLFWNVMGTDTLDKPSGKLLDQIDSKFDNLEKFKEEFKNTATSRFGSGWAWLVVDKNSNLKIMSTKNQDNPITIGLEPILGLDVWEHAYYLKYQNKRADYIDAWWNVVNWDKVSENYNKITSS